MRSCRVGKSPTAWHLAASLLLVGAVATGAVKAQEVSGLEAAIALEHSLVQAIAAAEKSVVSIARVKRNPDEAPGVFGQAFDPFRARGFRPAGNDVNDPQSPDYIPTRFGTGVVVDKRGLILTNYHVVDDYFLSDESGFGKQVDDLFVSTNHKIFRATIKAADPRSDLAVLEIDADNLVPMTLGDAGKLAKGQLVLTLGNPYAIARDGSPSAGWGIISNLARKIGPEFDEDSRTSKPTLHHFGTLIQTDAKLNLGTSGGALLNLKGEMVGLLTSQAQLAGYEQAAGYAIPVDDTFRRVVETLKEGREAEYGFLGVGPDNLTPRERDLGLRGMRIQTVRPGTPGDQAGLITGDVVVAVNGDEIHDADGLVLNVGKLPVEASVRLTVMRDGRLQVLAPVKLTKYPVRGKKIVSRQPPSWRGVRIDYATALERLVIAPHPDELPALMQGCIVATDVDSGTSAYEAGLRSGSLITHVGNKHVQTPAEFRAAVTGKSGPITLRINGRDDPVVIAP